MPNRVTARYRARDGTEHVVLVDRTPEGRWQVLDRAGGDTLVVETLTGHDDRLAQAEALARDYAAEQQAYHDGERLEDPLPRPRAAARRGAVMGGVNAADAPRQAAAPPALYDTRRRAMRILRPQPEPGLPPAPALPPPAGAGEARCAAACGSPTGACSPASCRPRATARSSSACCTPTRAGLVELTPGTRGTRRAARARPPPARRALPARRRQRPTATGCAALLAHAERIVAGDYATAPA